MFIWFLFLSLSFTGNFPPSGDGEHAWYTTVVAEKKLKIRKIIHTLDGDFVGAGYALDEHDIAHLSFVRLDRYGNVKWVKIDSTLYDCFSYTIVELPDGRFLWAGGIYAPPSSSAWLYPTYGVIDSIGNLLWTVSMDSVDDYIKDAVLTPENNILMVTRFGYIIITSPEGELITFKKLPPSSWDYGWDATWYFYNIAKTVYNDFLLLGERDSGLDYGYWYRYYRAAIVRINSNGDIIWARVFNDLPYTDDVYTESYFYEASMAMNNRMVITGGVVDSDWSTFRLVVVIIDVDTGDTIRSNVFETPVWINHVAVLRTFSDERYVILNAFQAQGLVHARVSVLGSDLSKKYSFDYACSSITGVYGFPTNLVQTSDGGFVFAIYGDTMNNMRGMRFVKPDPALYLGPSFKITYPEDTLLLDTADVNLDILWQGPVSKYGNIGYEVYLDDSLIGKTPAAVWNIGGIIQEGLHTIVVKGKDKMGVCMIPWEDTSYILVKTYPYINCISQLHDTAYPGPFKVIAEITDILSGIDSAFLFYQRSYEDSSWVKVRMDLASDTGSIYYAVIPRSVSPGPDTIRFYLAAYDGANPSHESFSPPDAPVKYYKFVANSPSGSHERWKERKSPYVKVNTTIKGVIFEIYSLKDDKISLNIWNSAGRSVYATEQSVDAGKVYLIKFNPPVKGVYFYKLKGKNLSKEGRVFYW